MTPAGTAQDLDAIIATYTDDIVFQNHTAGEAPLDGAAAVRAHLAGIFERWPDMRSSGRLYICRNLRERVDCRATCPTVACMMGRRRRVPDPRRADRPKDVYSTSHIARTL